MPHFDADAEAIVKEPFKYSGKDYKVGEPFPHKLLGVEVNTTLFGLFTSGRIRFDYAKRAAEKPKK